MNAAGREALWARLRAAALVDGGMPPHGEARSPWFVRLMLGVAGWIGALFLLGFVGAGFYTIFSDAAGALILGTLCCGGAFLLFRLKGTNDLVDQLGLAVSLAGQALIVFGFAEAFSEDSPTLFGFIALLQAVLVVVMPNVIHRVLSAAALALT